MQNQFNIKSEKGQMFFPNFVANYSSVKCVQKLANFSIANLHLRTLVTYLKSRI